MQTGKTTVDDVSNDLVHVRPDVSLLEEGERPFGTKMGELMSMFDSEKSESVGQKGTWRS